MNGRWVILTLLVAGMLATAGYVLAKPMIPTPADTPVLGELEPVLVKLLGENADADASLATICESAELKAQIVKHKIKLFGGPMLGCVTDTCAKFWVRTPVEASIQVIVKIPGDSVPGVKSKVVKTTKACDLTGIAEVSGLKPNSEYEYDVIVDGKSVIGAKRPVFRTYPSKGEKAKFSVGFGGGARYNPKYEHIWDTIASFKPIAFLFLGDNIYSDVPEERNTQRLYYYRRQLRPEFRRMTGSAAIYSIWDDHDFGDNDCEGGPETFKPAWKLPVWKVFKENWINPYYGGGPKQPGCWYDFAIGDVDFFMTDGRYYRSWKDGTMLGPVQKKWLLNKLKASKATFKVIASGTLWTETADKGGKDSWWGVKEEREEILSLIDKEKIGGVILISADRHRTDVYQIKRPNGYTLYEFETSKLTNNHTHRTKKQALFSYNKGHFFGMLNFDMTKDDPEMTFACITIDKKTVYTLTLKRSQLTSK
ncbi:MAG: alkaline phosphatase D family protein [Phycisphaerae bacterium]|jgi:alkaline phosphatase D|nr:alkaline phosphatase D family protein [Phycisphaerae bacterium]